MVQHSLFPDHSKTFRTITFSIEQQLFALDILYIRDIVIVKKIYRLPNSNPILIGVTNIRGEILPIYSIKKILDYPDRLSTDQDRTAMLEPKEDEYLIIVKIQEQCFAISVDQITNNLQVEPENYNSNNYIDNWNQQHIFSGVIINQSDNIIFIDGRKLKDYIIKSNKTTNLLDDEEY